MPFKTQHGSHDRMTEGHEAPAPETFESNGRVYEFVDPVTYMEELRAKGAREVLAEKGTPILVRHLPVGTRVPVWTENGDLESTESVGEGQVVATRCDEDGNPILNEHGHDNTWIQSESDLASTYDVDAIDENGMVKPRSGQPRRMIRIDKDAVVMKPWGENGALVPQVCRAGGYMNITDPENAYFIAEEEFSETHTVTEVIREGKDD